MNPSKTGFALGLVFAGIEFFFSDTASTTRDIEQIWVPILALLFLPSLGAILPRLSWARPLLALTAGFFLFLLGQDAALGSQAKTWIGSSWWCWTFPALFFASSWGLSKLRLPCSLSFFGAVAIYWTVTTQVPAEYQRLAEDLSGFAFAFGLLAIAPKEKSKITFSDMPKISLVLAVLSLGAIATSEPVARWSLDHGKLSSWVASHLRRSTPSNSAPAAMNRNAITYFGTPLQRSCTEERDEKFGKTKGVLFITIDALRFDMIGKKRNGLALTPFLDTLTNEAVTMLRAYSPAPISHWALFAAFSGLLPGQIVRHDHGLNAVPLICDRLEKQGVRTRASFTKRVHNARSRRFDFTRNDFGFKPATLHDLDPAIDQVIETVMPQESDKRWFSYVHLMTPHAPYDSAPTELTRGSSDFDRYCGEVRLADRQVREIVTAFRQSEQIANTWIIISADHGEAFGEHGAYFHGSNLYEEAIHVPLLICPPRPVKSEQVTSCVSLVDLAPTLDDLFDLTWNSRPAYAGRSWLPLILGRTEPQRLDQAIAESPAISLGRDKNLVAIITPNEKLILDREHNIRWLFDLKSDPEENHNILDQFPQRSAALMTRLLQGGAPPTQPDSFGRYLSLLEAMEDVAPKTVLASAMNTFKTDPTALTLFACWFLTHPPSAETIKFAAYLESRDGIIAGRCFDLSTLQTRWDPVIAKDLFQHLQDPFLRLGIYTLLSQHNVFDLPRVSAATRAREPLPVTLARTRNDVGNITFSKPDFDEVQHLIERGLTAKNMWVRRLTYELIGASQHPGSVPYLLLAEERSKSLPERMVILKAICSFESPAIAERLKQLANQEKSPIRDLVYQTWLDGRNLPGEGVKRFLPTFIDRFPTELELTADHETITVVSRIRASGPTKQIVKFLWTQGSVETVIDSQFKSNFVRSFLVPRGIKDIQVTLGDTNPRLAPLLLTSFLVIDNN